MSMHLTQEEVEYNMVTKSSYYIKGYMYRKQSSTDLLIMIPIFLPMVQEEIQHLGRGSKDHICSISTLLFSLQTSTPESIKHNLVSRLTS